MTRPATTSRAYWFAVAAYEKAGGVVSVRAVRVEACGLFGERGELALGFFFSGNGDPRTVGRIQSENPQRATKCSVPGHRKHPATKLVHQHRGDLNGMTVSLSQPSARSLRDLVPNLQRARVEPFGRRLSQRSSRFRLRSTAPIGVMVVSPGQFQQF